MKNYFSVKEKVTVKYEIKHSIFIGDLIPVKDVEDVKDLLSQAKKEHPKATHYCYSYRIGNENPQVKFSDDSEPSGTAGKPILGVLEANELTDVILIVTRYFGGIKLGANGLVRAYAQAASDAVNAAEICEFVHSVVVRIRSDYSMADRLIRLFDKESYKYDCDYQDVITYDVNVPFDKVERFIESLKEISYDIDYKILEEKYI